MQDYSDKTEEYFAAARKEIGPLLPARAESVLEVGCGTGATLRWLKESSRVGHATGSSCSSRLPSLRVRTLTA